MKTRPLSNAPGVFRRAVSDEDRISRFIEDVERSEFERQMVSLGPMYMNTGLGLDTEELLGDFRAFNELRVEVNLNGQDAVINHPVTFGFRRLNWLRTGVASTSSETSLLSNQPRCGVITPSI